MKADGTPIATPQGQQIQGIIPWMGDLVGSGAGAIPSMPLAREGYNEVRSGLQGIGSTVAAIPGGIKTALFGGTQGPVISNADSIPGMLPGAVKMALAPVEGGLGMLKFTDAMRSVNGADQPVRSQFTEEPNEQYRAYLDSLRQQYNPGRFFEQY